MRRSCWRVPSLTHPKEEAIGGNNRAIDTLRAELFVAAVLGAATKRHQSLFSTGTATVNAKRGTIVSRYPFSVSALATISILVFVGCSKSKLGKQTVHSPISRTKSKTDLRPGEVRSQSLAARTSNGGTFLQRVTASQSGLDFVHRWSPRNKLERDQIATAFAGGAVALGDVDNDGLPEIFLTQPHRGSRLYRNLGNFKFEEVTDELGLRSELANHWATGATFVDIQGDGFLDLYVCGYRSRNKLFVNTGKGSFVERAEQYGLDFAGASVMMSFVDFDRDGDLDAHLLTNRLSGQYRPRGLEFQIVDGQVVTPEKYRDEVGAILKKNGELYPFDAGQADRLFRNDSEPDDRSPRFTDVTESAGFDGHFQGLSATWWDYNSDGWIDLYVANDFFGPDQLYRNNRDGTFSDVIQETVPNTPWFSMGSDAGDLNGDGRLDFIASDMAATTHYTQKVNMGDMDAEGWFLEHGLPRQYMRNAVYINTGTSRFLEVAQMAGLAATDWTWAVKIVDFDSDGHNDVFFSNGMTRDFFHADLRAKMRELRDRTGENHWSDQPTLKQRNRFFRNHGSFVFEDVSNEWGVKEDTVSFGAATGDLDGDGDLDLVVNNFDDAVSLYRNNSTNGNLLKVVLRGSGANTHAIGAEVRIETDSGQQVRVQQPVRGFFGCDPAEVIFGLGEETKVRRLTVRWPSGKEQTVTNLLAGQQITIVEANAAPPIAESRSSEMLFAERPSASLPYHIEEEFDDFRVQPLLPNKLSLMGPAMVWGDMDQNGKPDCFLGGSHGHPAQLWLQSPAGKLFRQRIPFFNDHEVYEDVDAAMFDADGDGDLDLYVVSGGVEGDINSEQYQDRLYLSVENGLTVAPDGTLPDMNFSGGCVAVADFDNDGDNDLFIGARVIPGKYPTSVASKLLVNETPGPNGPVRFVEAPSEIAKVLSTVGMVTDALWSDVDSDNDNDLLVTTEYGPVKLFRNDGGRFVDATVEAGLAERLGWWNCVAAADVDTDGDTDYAIGNFGWNTKYHVTKENPQLLYYGDFGDSGKLNCVEAHLDDGTLVPNRGRSCSSRAMPFIAQKYRNFHTFATAGLADIYTAPRLQNSVKLEVNELTSGMLINDGHGKFEFRALPQLAQIAPSFGLAFLEANGDGKIDLYVSQNFYGPQRETGRMAGGVGLLLLGNGDGSFQELEPMKSGIIIASDARGAVAVDINSDGKDDLAVAINNDTVRILHNQRDDEHAIRSTAARQ